MGIEDVNVWDFSLILFNRLDSMALLMEVSPSPLPLFSPIRYKYIHCSVFYFVGG